MKKVVFIYTGSNEYGGLSRYLKLLFKNIDEKKIDLRLISLGEWSTSKKIEDERKQVIYLPKTRLSFATIFKISKYIKKEKVNLIVTAGLLSDFYGRKAGFLTGTPVLTTVHSDPNFDYPKFFKRTIYLLFDRPLRIATTKYVAVSNSVKEKLVKSGLKEDKVRVIYNGVQFVERKEKVSKGIVIGSLGRLHKTKGFDLLIRAMKDLPEEVILKIWGEGPERTALEKQIMTNDLTKRVMLMGATQKIEDAFSQIDIYVQASRMEGFGLTVVEAMSASLPVVVSPAGALAEVVKNGETGIVAAEVSQKALADAISELIKNKRLAGDITAAGEKDARSRFSIERWIKEMTEEFLETAK